MKFKDHFSGHAGDYAAFRPGYPPELFQWLAQAAPSRDTAWDCACGSGQAARPLAGFFRKVYATDASDRQIASAHAPENVQFAVAAAGASGLADASVDLICVAQALHWFDTEAFFREAGRVARDGAVLAVWMYGSTRVEGIDDAVFDEFEHETVGRYWPPERRWIDLGYANVTLPGSEIPVPAFNMRQDWPLDRLLGYIGSWSATRRYRAATGRDPIPGLRRRVAPEWGVPAQLRALAWRLVVRASRLDRPIS